MKEGLLKYLIVGAFAFLKASIPIEAHCPTLETSVKENYEKTESMQYKITKIKNINNKDYLCKEDYQL